MNCPYCGKPMETGRIVGRRDMGHIWLPEDEHTPLAAAKGIIQNKRGIILNEATMAKPGLVTYLCKECKKGVFELP